MIKHWPNNASDSSVFLRHDIKFINAMGSKNLEAKLSDHEQGCQISNFIFPGGPAPAKLDVLMNKNTR